MPLFAEQYEQIYGQLLKSVVDDTNITKTSIGSKTRAIIEALSGKLDQMYRRFDVNMAQAFLAGAEGKYLDFFGDMMGVSRYEQGVASSASSERNVKFYVDTGTFGDINGSSSITIPSGTVVSTGAGGTGVLYTVPYNVILSASDRETFVAVRAVSQGSRANVGARQLRHHDFINYTDYSSDSLKVINTSEIMRGRDGEVDTNYKFRITQQVTAAEKANLTAVRLAVLGTPGVADLVSLPFFQGIGSFDILIKATTPTVPDTLIEAVGEALAKVAAHGIYYQVRAPVETGFSMVGKLKLRKRLSPTEESNILTNVASNVADYVNSLDIGEELIVNELVERVMATSTEIKNVGKATLPFEEMYIYRPTKLQDNKIRNTLLGDYEPEEDERVVIEEEGAGTTPVLFSIV